MENTEIISTVEEAANVAEELTATEMNNVIEKSAKGNSAISTVVGAIAIVAAYEGLKYGVKWVSRKIRAKKEAKNNAEEILVDGESDIEK